MLVEHQKESLAALNAVWLPSLGAWAIAYFYNTVGGHSHVLFTLRIDGDKSLVDRYGVASGDPRSYPNMYSYTLFDSRDDALEFLAWLRLSDADLEWGTI